MKKALASLPKPATSTALADNLAAYAAQAEGAFSPNTLRALLADQRVFAAFCDQHGVTELPATPQTVAGFVRAMAAEKKPATIRRYLASISHKHRAAQAPDPCKADAVTLALKALHRAEGRAQKQAAPLRREHVVAALRARARLSLRDLRQRAIIATAYDSLCRASELVALRVKDITAADDGAATVLVRRAKNDQEGEGSVRYLRPDTMNHVRAWLSAAVLTEGELFRAVLKGGRVGGPLHECEISRAMRELAPKAAGRVSAHSTRIGACQDLAKAGISMLAVMQAGGWKTSAMPASYNRNQEAWRCWLKARAGAAREAGAVSAQAAATISACRTCTNRSWPNMPSMTATSVECYPPPRAAASYTSRTLGCRDRVSPVDRKGNGRFRGE